MVSDVSPSYPAGGGERMLWEQAEATDEAVRLAETLSLAWEDVEGPNRWAVEIECPESDDVLRLVEETVGRPAFDRFLRSYFDRHAFQSMTTAEFLSELRSELLAKFPGAEERVGRLGRAARASGFDAAVFHCECGDCLAEDVRLSVEEHDEIRAREDLILAPGHSTRQRRRNASAGSPGPQIGTTAANQPG